MARGDVESGLVEESVGQMVGLGAFLSSLMAAVSAGVAIIDGIEFGLRQMPAPPS